MAQEHDYDAIVLDVSAAGDQRLPDLLDAGRRGTGRRSRWLTAKDGELDGTEALDAGAHA